MQPFALTNNTILQLLSRHIENKMLKNSSKALRYTNYSEYNLINVWASNEKREAIIKHKLLTDKNFKLTSLQVNPLYKPIFDKLDAIALK